MKTKRIIILVSLMLGIALSVNAQDAKKTGYEAITLEAIQGQLEFLASDWTEGRETGTKGAYMAADYIASMFKFYGLEPGGDTPPPARRRRGEPPPPPAERTYFQNFDLVEYWTGDVQELSVVSKNGDAVKSVDFNYQTDFEIRSGRGVQTGMAGEVPVVFVGYGLQDEDNGYDDLKGLDLQGKIVIKLHGFPGHKNPGSKTYEKFKPEERQQRGDGRMMDMRMMYGRGFGRDPWVAEKGVLAVIEYNPDANPAASWSNNNNFFEAEIAEPSSRNGRSMSRPGNSISSSVSFSVTSRVINEIMSGLDVNFDDLEKKIAETGKPASMELPGKFIKFKTTVDSRMVKVRNVIGVLPGEDTTNMVVIGGHYDHLGIRDGWIFNGADDNASGTVGVMTIAKAMAASGVKPKKTVVFCAWTGEEKGLIGSNYFVDNPIDNMNILCNLNYDMISRDAQERDKERYPRMTFTSSFPLFQELTEKHNKEYKIDLDVVFSGSERPRGGSDHSPFAAKDIPIFYFMAGMPAEYHRPGDHIDLINWDKMLKIIQLGYLNIFELSNMDWK